MNDNKKDIDVNKDKEKDKRCFKEMSKLEDEAAMLEALREMVQTPDIDTRQKHSGVTKSLRVEEHEKTWEEKVKRKARVPQLQNADSIASLLEKSEQPSCSNPQKQSKKPVKKPVTSPMKPKEDLKSFSSENQVEQIKKHIEKSKTPPKNPSAPAGSPCTSESTRRVCVQIEERKKPLKLSRSKSEGDRFQIRKASSFFAENLCPIDPVQLSLSSVTEQLSQQQIHKLWRIESASTPKFHAFPHQMVSTQTPLKEGITVATNTDGEFDSSLYKRQQQQQEDEHQTGIINILTVPCRKNLNYETVGEQQEPHNEDMMTPKPPEQATSSVIFKNLPMFGRVADEEAEMAEDAAPAVDHPKLTLTTGIRKLLGGTETSSSDAEIKPTICALAPKGLRRDEFAATPKESKADTMLALDVGCLKKPKKSLPIRDLSLGPTTQKLAMDRVDLSLSKPRLITRAAQFLDPPSRPAPAPIYAPLSIRTSTSIPTSSTTPASTSSNPAIPTISISASPNSSTPPTAVTAFSIAASKSAVRKVLKTTTPSLGLPLKAMPECEMPSQQLKVERLTVPPDAEKPTEMDDTISKVLQSSFVKALGPYKEQPKENTTTLNEVVVLPEEQETQVGKNDLNLQQMQHKEAEKEEESLRKSDSMRTITIIGRDTNIRSKYEDHCHLDRQQGVDKRASRKLIFACILCVIFMIVEVIGGILSKSLAIATDAAHLLTDLAGFMISLFAIHLAGRPSSQRFNFGWYRAEVIGAMLSVYFIWVITGILVFLAVQRLRTGVHEVDATIMLISAVLAILVNVIMACQLNHGHSHGAAEISESHRIPRKVNIEVNDLPSNITMTTVTTALNTSKSLVVIDREPEFVNASVSTYQALHQNHQAENINVRAAMIHVIGDIIQGVGVFVAALIIYFNPAWAFVDSICTFIFSIIVLVVTFRILRDVIMVLMEATPDYMDYEEVHRLFLSIDGVVHVHNLRIWALSIDKVALSAHLAIRKDADPQVILEMAKTLIHQRYSLFETTIQIEEYRSNMQVETCAREGTTAKLKEHQDSTSQPNL